MKLRRTLASLAIGSALVATSISGGGPATAAVTAQPQALAADYAQLVISPAGNGYYTVTVSGDANITGASGWNLVVNLYGDDEWFDDFLLRSPLHSTDPAGGFGVQLTVHGSTLNEDWGQDEVYAVAYVQDINGSQHRIRTNTVKAYF